MNETKTLYPLPFRVPLDVARYKKLMQLAKLDDLTMQECMRRLIDTGWEQRRPLVEYMKVEPR